MNHPENPDDIIPAADDEATPEIAADDAGASAMAERASKARRGQDEDDEAGS